MKSLSLQQFQQAGAFALNECKNVLITFLAAKAVIGGQLTLGAVLLAQAGIAGVALAQAAGAVFPLALPVLANM